MKPERFKITFKRDGRYVLFMCFRHMGFHELKLLACAKRLELYGDFTVDDFVLMERLQVIDDKDVLSERCIDLIRVQDLSR